MAVKTVDEYIQKHPYWQEELTSLREMILSTGMEETIKWGGPVYMVNSKNVVSIAAFKNHCALWFYQGALLKENTALLQNAQEGKTKALRQVRFGKGNDIPYETLRSYVLEAIQNQKEGKEIKPEPGKAVEIPEVLGRAFASDEALKKAFFDLTPGRQREYVQHLNDAKQEATQLRRLEKINPMIKSGTGLHDKYKK